jgi:hypothetical protein
MAVEVRVEGLLGSFQDQMAIRAIVDVVGNRCGDAGRETALQVLTNQSNSLPAGHAGPLKCLPPWITEHELLQLFLQAHASIEPLKSIIYEKLTSTLGRQKSNREGNFCTDESISAWSAW